MVLLKTKVSLNSDTEIQCGNLKRKVNDSIWKNVCTSPEMVWIVCRSPTSVPMSRHRKVVKVSKNRTLLSAGNISRGLFTE